MRARRWRSIALAAGCGAVLVACAAQLGAQDTTARGVRIGLTYDPGRKPGVLVLPTSGPGGDSVRAILQRDLDYGDRVTVIGGDAGGAGVSVAAGSATLNYPLLAKLGAAAVVQPSVTTSGVHVALHDVAAARVVEVRDFALSSPSGSGEWRMALHAVSDEIERWITGTRGIAATRVLFVRDGRVNVTDSDGWGARVITDRGTALSPAWRPDGRSFAYSAFGSGGTDIVVRDLSGGAPRTVARGSLNITPTWSPDGNTLAYAHGEEDGTDLFAVSADGGGPRRITIGRGTDNVSPTFSPDGRRIAFTSGRSGHPEVYITDVDGTNAELLTPFAFGDQYYRSNPDWSPDGRVIAFQSQIGGQFQVMTIGLRDRAVKQLTSEGRNEDPSWAPDGRHLVFTSTRTGMKQLFVLDVESGRVRQLTHGSAARLAAWSRTLARTP